MLHTNVGCALFSGYKPCGFSERSGQCPARCTGFLARGPRILLIHLGALGAVVRSTALLQAIQRKYAHAHVTWVTQAPAHHLLQGHAGIDRVVTTDALDLLTVRALRFDVIFCVDKSLAAAAIASAQIEAQQGRQELTPALFGFRHHPESGAILPATEAAERLWQMGLSDHEKFFVNTQSEAELTCRALELPYARDPYWLDLSKPESIEADQRRTRWLKNRQFIIGINTGCSQTLPAKKLTVQNHIELIRKLNLQVPDCQVVLLGGREDSNRNQDIAQVCADVILSDTDKGLRDGLISVSACDLVISGDSLGMHLAIALRKQVIAWFGPTCAQEIDLFDRGIKVQTAAGCSPCWKRNCNQSAMCYDQVSDDAIVSAVQQLAKKRSDSTLSEAVGRSAGNAMTKGVVWNESSSTKQLSLETSSLPFP